MLKTSPTTKQSYFFKLLLCCCFVINYNITNAQIEQSNQTHCPGDTITILPPPLGPLGPLPASCETLTVTPDDENIITLPNNEGFLVVVGNTSTQYTIIRTGIVADGCYSSPFEVSAVTNIVIGSDCDAPHDVITQTQTVCNNDTLVLQIGDSFEYSVMEQPSNGTLFFTSNGASSGTDLHYVPNSSFVGMDQFMIHYTNTSTGDEYVISFDVTVNDCGDPTDPTDPTEPDTPYTWLNDLIDANDCCANASVIEFSMGTYSFIYIQTGDDCSAFSSLYLNDGSYYCTDASNFDCLGAYGLNASDGTVLYTCGDDPTDPTDPIDFDEYPWLADLIDADDCCANESILVFELGGGYSFLYIKTASDCGGLGSLYLSTGQLYCNDAANFDCLGAYGFNESDGVTLWACSNDPTDPTDPTDPIPDYPWLSDVITDDCCANTRVYHYIKNNGSYGYIYVETGDCQDGSYSRLYNEEGQLYCTSAATVSCFDHYDLDNSFTETFLWSCDGTEGESTNSSNTEGQFDRLITSENLVTFNVFPNPSTGLINISVDTDYEGVESIIIYDLSGRIINEFIFESASVKLFQTDLSDLPNGLYLIQYQNANVSSIEKIMIRH